MGDPDKLKYLNSLQNDDLVIRSLPLPCYRITGDQFNNLKEYIPTVFIYFIVDGQKKWLPVEIKCSKKISPLMPFLDVKRNQASKMFMIEGAFLFSGIKDFTVITAETVKNTGEETVSDFFGKPCYRLIPNQLNWLSYNTPLKFV